MKKLLIALTLGCMPLITMQVEGVEHAQEKSMKQLLSVINIDDSQIPDICSPYICQNEHFIEECLSSQLLNGSNTAIQSKSSSNKIETRSVMINRVEGYTFHVADHYGYWGNSRVVTCLDGPLRGLQGISDNGVVTAESTDVKWHNDYFEHKYPAAKITSYSNKQIIKFN